MTSPGNRGHNVELIGEIGRSGAFEAQEGQACKTQVDTLRVLRAGPDPEALVRYAPYDRYCARGEQTRARLAEVAIE